MNLIRYLRIQYKHGARGWTEGDCFNLPLLFYSEELRIKLKDYTEGYAENWSELGNDYFLKLYRKWGFSKIEGPAYGDIVLFSIGGKVNHCGVVVDPDNFLFLHTGKGGTCVGNYVTDFQWAARVYGFYRHRKMLRTINEN